MGWFSSICSAASSFVSGAVSVAKSAVSAVVDVGKKVVEKTVDTVKTVGQWAKDKAVAAKDWVVDKWKDFTGQNMAEKAQELLEAAKEKYEKATRDFEVKSSDLVNRIGKKIKNINELKLKLLKNHFVKYKILLSEFRDIEESKKAFIEENFNHSFVYENIRTIEQVMKIDFVNHPIKNNLLAIFTLGFMTRKKAKESLEQAERETAKVDLNISKMNAEIVRLESIEKSLENIEVFFMELTNLLEKAIISVQSEINRKSLLRVLKNVFSSEKHSVRDLPKVSQKYLEYSFILASTLSTMTQKSYVNENQILDSEISKVIEIKEKFNKNISSYIA